MNSNIYTIAFPFNGKFYYAVFNANMIANIAIQDIASDAIADMNSEHNQWFGHRFTDSRGKHYLATFAYDTVNYLNVFECTTDNPDDDSYDEHLVEGNIPYTVIKIENENGIIFNLSEIV